MRAQNRGPNCRRDKHSDSSRSNVLLLTARPGGREGVAEIILIWNQSEGWCSLNAQEKVRLLKDDRGEETDSMD